jgi:hypothetical protein
MPGALGVQLMSIMPGAFVVQYAWCICCAFVVH